MAGKFRIFCDESPRSSFEPEDKQVGGQQHLQQLTSLHQQQLKGVAGAAAAADNSASQPTAGNNNNNPEQEKFLALLGNLPANGAQHNANNQAKREPLGLRQPLGQSSMAAEPQLAGPSTSGLSVGNDEDQENDISMASLGSDFVPSIIHDDDQFDSFEVEEDDEEDELVGSFDPTRGAALVLDEDELIDDEDEIDLELEDEEFRMELSQAFKQHDDSQLFKSTVFIDDIQSYLHNLERTAELRPLPNYMDYQNDIDPAKRAILINWLVEVSDEYNLQPETLFICTAIIDRFLSEMCVSTSNLQLLGVAAMFIASKYEEIYPPNLYQFVELTDETYSGQQIRQMEQEILKTLNFRISLPTISFFLRQLFAFNKFPKKVYHLAEYLTYLSLLDDQPILEYYPSEIALAALILAAHQLGAQGNVSAELRGAFDNSNLAQLSRRKTAPKGRRLNEIDRRAFIIDTKLPFCIEALRSLQERAYKKSTRLRTDSAVHYKFSQASNSCVTQLQPPNEEELKSIVG